jgi:hypothetical protein
MEIKINLNETVKVKLTQFGKDIYMHQYDEVINKYPLLKISRPEIKIDENGYTEFILWHFMNLYGSYMELGEPEVIKPLEIIYKRESES